MDTGTVSVGLHGGIAKPPGQKCLPAYKTSSSLLLEPLNSQP